MEILSEYEDLDYGQAEKLCEIILKKAYPKRLKSRSQIQVKNTKTKERLDKAKSVETDNVEIFNRLLYAIRQAEGHRFIKAIKPTDTEFQMLKEVTQIANEFVEMYQIKPKEEGFKTFIRIGLGFIGKKYAINKYKYHKTNIFEFYKNSVILQEDSDPKATQAFYEIWQQYMEIWANIEIELETSEQKINILYARMEADEVEADYEDWIRAQFEELAWLKAIPELGQLHGKKAKERYEKYLINSQRNEKEDIDTTIPTKHETEEQRLYWELVNQRRKERAKK